MAYFEGEIPTVVSGNNSNGFGNGFSDGWWGIILIALLFGWGRGGYGFGGGNGGNGEVVGYYKNIGNDPQKYLDLAKQFLEDDDIELSPSEKVYAYLNYIVLGKELKEDEV